MWLHLLAIAGLCSFGFGEPQECKLTEAGHEYMGTKSVTVNGLECQRWSSDTPHEPNAAYTDDSFPDGSIAAAENYCRNPDPDWLQGVWCYTVHPDVRWEACDVQMCDVAMVPAEAPEAKPACGIPTAMTQAEIDEMLVQHNEVRRTSGGADEFRLTWDKNLAARAQEWASQCEGIHGMMTDCNGNGVGQNGYMSSSTHFDPTSVVSYWASEKYAWDAETQSCKSGAECGHWTQIVWSTTRMVGCGYATCRTGWALRVYCDYYPQGNYGGSPYVPGPPCTACYEQTFGSHIEPGYKCVDDLCEPCNPTIQSNCECGPSSLCENGSLDRGTCTCKCPSEYWGTKCEIPCEDKESEGACTYWKGLNYCNEDYVAFMRDNCAVTCGYC